MWNSKSTILYLFGRCKVFVSLCTKAGIPYYARAAARGAILAHRPLTRACCSSDETSSLSFLFLAVLSFFLSRTPTRWPGARTAFRIRENSRTRGRSVAEFKRPVCLTRAHLQLRSYCASANFLLLPRARTLIGVNVPYAGPGYCFPRVYNCVANGAE